MLEMGTRKYCTEVVICVYLYRIQIRIASLKGRIESVEYDWVEPSSWIVGPGYAATFS
jgi:hypothetical protein